MLDYQVFRSDNFGLPVQVGSSSSLSYVDEKVESDTYYYSVRAVGNNDISPSATVSIIIPDVSELIQGRVTGLQLFEQGNNTEFFNQDAKFVWNFNIGAELSTEVGSELNGADSDLQKDVLRHFNIRVLDAVSGAEIRVENGLLQNEYIYTIEKNIEDGGPNRSFTFEVTSVDVYNNYSDPATITVSNPAPGALTFV